MFNGAMPLSSLAWSINAFFGSFIGVQAGMEMIEQMLKEKNIPDLQGSESLEFLKVDYVNYNFSK